MSIYSDIWALGCILFEIKSGEQLFGDWTGTKDDILRQMVSALGKLPEPWWTAARKFELDEKIADIGAEDEEEDDPGRNCAVMLEPSGVKVEKEEASQMKDLLERILKWKPEERISIKEIMDSRWPL
ncbi:33ab4c0c-e259-4121-b2b0-1f3406a084e2 [Sclerotinia trifoliorum]|uniref:33ab4c0c-e259-4121-b2b0-1f3406a084e2 n=1 Tax=Sclerotinia trifoliorum TaxID=28548 RepID=A0A8H2ZUG8_9HELO|nr:33ab4c0c-e259-4121-b2b0-1f3406a084e2 [Sclerotinia trifoliorum]